MKLMVGLGLMKILYIDNVYRFEGSCQNYMNLNKYTPGAVFDEFFEDRMWTILSENTNMYVHAKLLEWHIRNAKILIPLSV